MLLLGQESGARSTCSPEIWTNCESAWLDHVQSSVGFCYLVTLAWQWNMSYNIDTHFGCAIAMFQCQRVRRIWSFSFNILSFLGMFQAHVGWWSYNWHAGQPWINNPPRGCLIVGYMGHQLGITSHLTLLINQPMFIHRPLALSAHCAWGQLYNTDTENSWVPVRKVTYTISVFHVSLYLIMLIYWSWWWITPNTPRIPKVGYIYDISNCFIQINYSNYCWC